MSGPVVLPLDCPECGQPLPGLEADVAFACSSCGRAWEITDGRFAPRPFVQVGHTATPGEVFVNLPAWQFPLRVRVAAAAASPATASAGAAAVSADPAPQPAAPRAGDVQRAAERATGLRTAYALACAIPRTEVFGDWGHRWTGLQPSWTPGERPYVVVGASLSSADAGLLVQHYALDLLDRITDLEMLKVKIEHGEPRLLGVPVAVRERQLVSPWGADLELPVHALDGWVQIRERATIHD